MRVTNHTHAWTHTSKNGVYHCFTCLYPVIISNSMKASEYWHKHPVLKLSLISHSSALILAHITNVILSQGACNTVFHYSYHCHEKCLQSKPLQSVISMYNTLSLEICLIYMHLPEGHTYKSGKSLTALL